MHRKNLKYAGKKVSESKIVLIMIHGRGADANDILSVAEHLHHTDYALIAPEATNNTWYPYSFMAPVNQNEPWLSSALNLLGEIESEVVSQGISPEKIFFLGFSQGACLMLEYITRNAKKYGGAIAFTGGLIGEVLNTENYKGSFDGMQIFMGSSDPDPHIPVWRVQETVNILNAKGAEVKVKIYPGMGHTISRDELNEADKILSGE